MIYTYSYISKKQLESKIAPQSDTFVIQISNPSKELKVEPGYYGDLTISCLDDLYDNHLDKVLTLDQATQITRALDEIDRTPDLLDILICCDTGKTASAAVAAFISTRYPKAKTHQSINTEFINKQILRTLKIVNYKGMQPFGTEAMAMNLAQSRDDGIQLLNRISERSLFQNILVFKKWVIDSF